MLLIQQSTSFRLWTSRALMVYFRRALLFLVVSPRHQRFLTCEQQQQEQKICFSDAEDDEQTMINEKIEMKSSLINQTEDRLNSSIEIDVTNSPIKTRSDQSLIVVDFTESLDHSKKLAMKTNNRIEIYDKSIQRISHLNSLDLILRSPIDHIDINRQSLHLPSYSENSSSSSSSDDEDDIYEKYQTSFSHILHQENKRHSMLVLKPNTSLVTVRPLPSHSYNRNTLDYPILTNHVSVRLIAYQTDRIIHADIKPIGCRKKHVF